MRRIESGVNFEGYEFIIGSKYIHAVSAEYGPPAKPLTRKPLKSANNFVSASP